MRKLFFVVLLFVVPVFCWGQGENNIWHFGNHAGINFNSGTPVAINGPTNTWEGTSSICNSSGNLLFSTDGIKVFKSNGTLMGTGLFGDQSSTQSALIIPFPGNDSLYYIFTSDAMAGAHGICYSIVNMNLNSGMGGLVSINNQLITPACEKLTAIRNSNGLDYWVIVHALGNNSFYIYPITIAGVGTPLIISIGLSFTDFYNAYGALNGSVNGQKIATAKWKGPADTVMIFNFNDTTGVLSNCIYIPSFGCSYGICFSPDNSKLYVSSSNYNFNSRIEQYDLTLPNFQNFPYLVAMSYEIGYRYLQLAPDGKIYCVKATLSNSTPYDSVLCTIDYPNLAGYACNFVDSSFTLLSGKYSEIGLPNFIDGFFFNSNCTVNLGGDIIWCGNSSSAILDAGSGHTNYLWNTGNTTQNISAIDTGNYIVTVTNAYGCSSSDTINVKISAPYSSINSITDTLGCSNSQSGEVDINIFGGIGTYTYQWSNGATTQDLNNLTAGTYTVTVTDSIGCIVSNPPITIVQINDLQVNNTSFNNLKCHDDTNGFINVTVLNGLSPNNYEWSNGETTEDLNNLTAGTYSVTVSDAGGCTASDTVVITAPNQLIASLNIAADTVFCSVTGGTPFYHYLWSTGATTSFIDSATNGIYTVTVSDINNCTAMASVVISDVPSVNDEGDFSIYPNPASGLVTVVSGQLAPHEIQITDILGRIITDHFHLTTFPSSIDVSNYSEGIYFIKLVSSSGVTVVKKFVVVH